MFGWAVRATGTGWVTYAIIAAVAAFAVWWIYDFGYDRATAIGDARYAKREVEIVNATNAELNRVAQANALAKAMEARRIAQLAEENAALEKKIKELSDEADADPDRDRVCLSDGSRLRIDQIH